LNRGDVKSRETAAKSFIGKKLRDLRKGRGLSQGDLGKILGLSQSSLSEIELGQTSLSAEQFIEILKFFNVPASHFDPAPGDSDGAIQKALAAQGASHLVEDPNLLPSEHLARVDAIVRETLVAGENPRALTALAPVIISNIGQINLPQLFARFKDYNLENRYGWLIDNILEAIALVVQDAPPRKQALALAKAATVLLPHRERIHHGQAGHAYLGEDYLGVSLATTRTKNEVLRTCSEISRDWHILTTIQVEDFAKAIKESHVSDTH
jgi:transcriptional regulator with XRE-family HTH domain